MIADSRAPAPAGTRIFPFATRVDSYVRAADSVDMPLTTSNEIENDGEWRRLMAAAQAGDRAAYERLLRQVLPFIRAIVARQHRAQDHVEDAVQDVLLTLHRVRHTYDPSRPFTHWLATLARRRSIDLLRRKSRLAAAEAADQIAYEPFADPGANNERERRDWSGALRGALAALPERQRRAVELTKLRELSLAEASVASGMSIGALKINVHRAIKAMRKRLAGERE
jgi:RNA polymerase sigma-70 factor (ECF subfamily)